MYCDDGPELRDDMLLGESGDSRSVALGLRVALAQKENDALRVDRHLAQVRIIDLRHFSIWE